MLKTIFTASAITLAVIRAGPATIQEFEPIICGGCPPSQFCALLPVPSNLPPWEQPLGRQYACEPRPNFPLTRKCNPDCDSTKECRLISGTQRFGCQAPIPALVPNCGGGCGDGEVCRFLEARDPNIIPRIVNPRSGCVSRCGGPCRPGTKCQIIPQTPVAKNAPWQCLPIITPAPPTPPVPAPQPNPNAGPAPSPGTKPKPPITPSPGPSPGTGPAPGPTPGPTPGTKPTPNPGPSPGPSPGAMPGPSAGPGGGPTPNIPLVNQGKDCPNGCPPGQVCKLYAIYNIHICAYPWVNV